MNNPNDSKSGRNIPSSACLIPVILILLLLAAVAVAAGWYLKATSLSEVNLLPAPGPEVVIQEPFGGAYIQQGGAFPVVVVARDESGVGRIELWIDGLLVLTQDSPFVEGTTPLTLTQSMLASQPGTHMLVARAYDTLGALGESMAVFVTVTAEESFMPEQKPVEYIAGENDTLESIAAETGNALDVILAGNPGLANPLAMGQIVVIPQPVIPQWQLQAVPGAIGAILPLQPVGGIGNLSGFQPSGSIEIEAGQPANLVPNPAPNSFPQEPSPSLIKAPILSGSMQAPGGCSFSFQWTDNSNNESGFAIYRRRLPDQPFPILLRTLPPNTTSYTDKLPGSGTYEYSVDALGSLGAVSMRLGERWYQPIFERQVFESSRSNPVTITIPAGQGCPDTTTVKRIYFQILSIRPADANISHVAFWYSLNNSASRRIPVQNSKFSYTGDIKYSPPESLPLPSSAWLNPDQPVVVKIWAAGYTQAGWAAGNGVVDLGAAFGTHTLSSIPTAKSGNFFSAQGSGFTIDYFLWTEDLKWNGQASSATTLKPPTNLRVTNTSVIARTLAWDWMGNSTTIDGFIFYRSYICPGDVRQFVAPKVVPANSRQLEINFKNEPAGCSYNYQVTAYGRDGESSPSNTLQGDTESAYAGIRVTFTSLRISGLPEMTGVGRIDLVVNQASRSSDLLLIKPGAINLDGVILDGQRPNNSLSLNMAQNEFLTLGFSVSIYNADGQTVPDGVCRGAAIFPPISKWRAIGILYTFQDPNGTCALTVRLDGQAPLPVSAGGYVLPQADLAITKVAYIGTEVFAYIENKGPDDLPNQTISIYSSILLAGTDKCSGFNLPGCAPSVSNIKYRPGDIRVLLQSNLPLWVRLYDSKTGVHSCGSELNYCWQSGCQLPLVLEVLLGSGLSVVDTNTTNNHLLILTRDIQPLK